MSFLHTRLIAYGFLLGTAGVKVLSSKEAKKVYTHATAAVLRGIDEASKLYATIKENCEDIHADAVALNQERALEAQDNLIEDSK